MPLRFSRREKTILALMSAVHFCLIVDFMVVMPQGPQLMRSLQISARQFGLLVSAYTLGAGLLSLVASVFIDRFDRKKALLLVFSGFAFCNLACALSSSYDALIFSRFITGAFGGIVGSLLFSIVSDSIEQERRATALGIVMAAFALASIVGVPLCLFVGHRWGWAASFYGLALSAGAVWLTVLVYLPSSEIQLAERGGGFRQALSQFRDLVSHPSRALALLFMSFLILGHFSIIPFLFPSVVANGGIAEAKLPVIYLVGGCASIVSTVLIGKASDLYGKKWVFSLALIGSLIPIFLVTHLQALPLWSAVLIVTSFFVLMGGRLAPATALVTSTVLPRNRGGFMSLVGSVQQLSAAVGALISGLLVSKAADGKLMGFAQVGFLAMAFSLAALILSRKIVSVEGEEASP